MTPDSTNSLDYLKKKIRTQMNEMSDHISCGGCQDFSDYTKCCGVIEGLATAERELLDIIEKMEAN